MEQARASSVPELRKNADHLVARANAMEANRDAALTLLTADALVTLACELEYQSKDGV